MGYWIEFAELNTRKEIMNSWLVDKKNVKRLENQGQKDKRIVYFLGNNMVRN